VIEIASIDWSKWIGDESSGLNSGDKPETYKEKRNDAMAENTTN
jgi:hypothetical protein